MGKSKSHDRSPGETQITISLPVWLKEELTKLAKADERSRSKWITRELAALLERKRAERITPITDPRAGDLANGGPLFGLPKAAEEPPEYKQRKKRRAG